MAAMVPCYFVKYFENKVLLRILSVSDRTRAFNIAKRYINIGGESVVILQTDHAYIGESQALRFIKFIR